MRDVGFNPKPSNQVSGAEEKVRTIQEDTTNATTRLEELQRQRQVHTPDPAASERKDKKLKL